MAKRRTKKSLTYKRWMVLVDDTVRSIHRTKAEATNALKKLPRGEKGKLQPTTLCPAWAEPK